MIHAVVGDVSISALLAGFFENGMDPSHVGRSQSYCTQVNMLSDDILSFLHACMSFLLLLTVVSHHGKLGNRYTDAKPVSIINSRPLTAEGPVDVEVILVPLVILVLPKMRCVSALFQHTLQVQRV